MNVIPWTVALLAMFGFGYWARGHDTPNPPAGGTAGAIPRGAAETANCPPGAVPPAGASSPPAAPSASPPPGVGPTKCFDFRAAGWDCGCLIISDRLHHKQRRDLCERHQFAAEWNERLAQS